MKDSDRWPILMDLAKTRSRHQVPNPDLRVFLEENLVRLYPDDYLRLLEIELMASFTLKEASSEFALETWMDAQEKLDGLLDECKTQEELESALTMESDPYYRSGLFIWSLLDRDPEVDSGEYTRSLWLAADRAVLARLSFEGNPEGEHLRDRTTELLAICRAKRGNDLRVRGDVIGGLQLARNANSLLRPGGDPYVTGKVFSYLVSSCIASGHLTRAREKAKLALGIFEKLGLLTETTVVLTNIAHIDMLCGSSPRKLLADFLVAKQDSPLLPTNSIALAKIALVNALIYFHEGEGAKEVLRELTQSDLGEVERLWARHLEAILSLRSGDREEAGEEFREVASEFFRLKQYNQANFLLLFEALSLLEAGQMARAIERATLAGRYFSSTRFYGGAAAHAASRLLDKIRFESLNRAAIIEVIDVVLSPAKKKLDRAQES